MSKKRMRKRRSVQYAEWTPTREESFRKYCENILYKLYKHEKSISIENDKAYLVSENSKTLLRKIDDPKSTWWEIWIELKEL